MTDKRVSILRISGGFGNAYGGQRKAWVVVKRHYHPQRTVLASPTVGGICRAVAFAGDN